MKFSAWICAATSVTLHVDATVDEQDLIITYESAADAQRWGFLDYIAQSIVYEYFPIRIMGRA